ncbi:MAG: putative two component transcriptional regulator, LuxR family [Verrucomicrobiaceae bacterium]|nr:putative two component transcriptional regulator, LuxR family [Verrucomicrobiaceae bacterium]
MQVAHLTSASLRSKRRVVLLVEDNEIYRTVVAAALGQYLQAYDILQAGSVQSALQMLSSRRPDVMVADMTLPDGTAITLLEAAQGFLGEGLKAIIFSNHTSEDMLPLLDRHDVYAYVEKASGPRHLAETIQAAERDGSHVSTFSPPAV